MRIGKLMRLFKPKFYFTYNKRSEPKSILDIGVANNSYRECKWVFPKAKYTGLDKYPLTIERDDDSFVLCDLETDDLISRVNQQTFDLIIVNHVLEHLNNGEEVFKNLCSILSPGGSIYCEFPSLRTAMSKKTRYSYHFHDDPTHKRFYSLEMLANLSMASGCQVVSCGPASTPVKDILSLPRAAIDMARGKGYGSALLFLQRKIDYMYCKKNLEQSQAEERP